VQQAEHLMMAEPFTRAPILVLGIGNILLRDEGVGVHAVRAMDSAPLPDGVELLDGGTAGADLLDAISERRKLIVVDALDAEVAPGTILRMKPQDLKADPSAGISLHEFGIAQTLTMAQQLHCCPADVTIIAIAPQDTQCGLELSPQMKQWMPRIIEAVLHELSA
jgi:hydrogenase maturation protease